MFKLINWKKLFDRLGNNNKRRKKIRKNISNIQNKLTFSDIKRNAGLKKALRMTPEEIISEITDSKLRGSGGAGFPTGLKLKFALQAEGEKKSAILKAEGQAEAIKKVADADKYQKLTVAKGEAEAISTVYQAIHDGNPTNDLIAIKYLEALQKIADGQSTKIFLPLEASGVLGSIAGVGELFKEKEIPGSREEK